MNSQFNDFGNQQVSNLPFHLRQFVVDQGFSNYTSVDHAVWRYVMRKSIAYLKQVADDIYIKGLKKTGITIDSIPNIKDMNDILGEIGWGCVCVDGFLPPSAFMEFQAYKVLVIAADIRQLEHIEYTPAPDILHEAAGHAPIIADPGYAEYLRLFGEIGAKAISSGKDFELYEAIRHLSIIKEDPSTPEADVVKAEKLIDDIQGNMGEPSEMAQIRNLHWWTVEYGMIGDVKNPRLYGAGLLSSIGESQSCMKDEVIKLPYTIDALKMSFDITETQPQLYVTPNYRKLTEVLEEFANSMSLRIGGLYGLGKAIESKNTCTAEYNSGLQVSGTFSKLITKEDKPIYLATSSATALAWQDKELVGHGKKYHADGFGSPVGKLKDVETPIEFLNMDELASCGIEMAKEVTLHFESGVVVKGKLANVRKNRRGVNMIMSFDDCTVTYEGETLFQPEWGVYDMAIGQSIVSVYSGAADVGVFEKGVVLEIKEKTHKINYSQQRLALHYLYSSVRSVREGSSSQEALYKVWSELRDNHSQDWLCALEVLEASTDKSLQTEVKDYLLAKSESTEYSNLIFEGIKLI